MLKNMLFSGLIGGAFALGLLSLARVRPTKAAPTSLLRSDGLEIQSLIMILMLTLSICLVPIVCVPGNRVLLGVLLGCLSFAGAYGLRRSHFRWLRSDEIVGGKE